MGQETRSFFVPHARAIPEAQGRSCVLPGRAALRILLLVAIVFSTLFFVSVSRDRQLSRDPRENA
jgi:hypothetical protein